MAQPFYMAYEAKFDGMAHVADITRQFQNVRKYLYNPEKGLNYHAYDEARVQFWADKETGCSKNFSDTTGSICISRNSRIIASGSGQSFGSNLKSPCIVQWKKSTTIASIGRPRRLYSRATASSSSWVR